MYLYGGERREMMVYRRRRINITSSLALFIYILQFGSERFSQRISHILHTSTRPTRSHKQPYSHSHHHHQYYHSIHLPARLTHRLPPKSMSKSWEIDPDTRRKVPRASTPLKLN